MRAATILLAVASLSACHQDDQHRASGGDAVALATVAPASFTFDGAVSTDPAARRAHGARMAKVLGCTGCHTESLQGALFNDDTPDQGKLYASNLTRVLPTMSDDQIRTLLRTGRHPVRGDLWVMPAEVFQRLSEADMNDLIAHLRTIKPGGAATPPPAWSAAGRALIASGKMKPVAAYMAKYRDKTPPDMGPAHAFGRYLAGATCSECHGPDLTGIPDFGPNLSTPDLDIAGAYSPAELATLLTVGKGKTRADLGLMSKVGAGHFSALTPHERSALIGYVLARANRPR